MIKELIKNYNHVWLIGIAGSGMCGIAEILIRIGFRVAGSDLQNNEVVKFLRELGAQIQIGHDARNIKDVDVVIYSSAVREDNVELQQAHALNIPTIRRAEMLAELMRLKTGIAISGSHGKTTITSIVGKIFSLSRFDPTVIVGGRLRQMHSSAVAGTSDILIAEADEFDQSFLKLAPVFVLINNIDDDHLECYNNSYEELENAFIRFANSVPFYGRVAACIDEPSLHNILPRITRNVVTYGLSPHADVRADEIRYEGEKTSFNLVLKGEKSGRIEIPLPGKYNVLNALGAIAVANEFDISFTTIKKALETFDGVQRRFELIGEHNNIKVFSDFAHHPTAISATLEAAKSSYKRRIIAVFQAHLFSRTQKLVPQFGQALLGADQALVLPIYPAREDPIPGVTAELIVDAARGLGHKNILYVEDKSTIADQVKSIAKSGDMVLVIGAGSVNQLAPEILETLQDKD